MGRADFVTGFDRKSLPDNIMDRVRVAETNIVQARLSSSNPATDPSDVMVDGVWRGDLYTGGGTPNDGSYTGVFVSQEGFTFNGVLFNVGGVNNGVLEFGLSAVDGTALFAAGAGVINTAGVTMTGLYYPLQFNATNAGNTRTARFGMVLLGTSTVPSHQWLFNAPAGTTLVVDGTFTSGLTGWTDSASAYSVVLGGDGVYYAVHSPTVLTLPAELTQVITGLSAGTSYNIQFDSQNAFGYLTPRLYLDWRNSGHSVISTQTLYGNKGVGWQTATGTYTAPTGTVEVNLRFNPGGDPFQMAEFRNISFASAGATTSVELTDNYFQVDESILMAQLSVAPTTPASGYENIALLSNDLGIVTHPSGFTDTFSQPLSPVNNSNTALIQEFNTTSLSGLTWNSGSPNVSDANTTVPGHWYIREAGATAPASGEIRIGTFSWSPTGAFSVITKFHMACETQAGTRPDVLFMVGDVTLANRALVGLVVGSMTTGAITIQAYTYTGSTYTQRGATSAASILEGQDVWFRIDRDGSNNVSFYYSLSGKQSSWAFIATQSFTFTMATVGICIQAPPGAYNAFRVGVDFIRGL